jgi:hypothetical protein
VQSENRSGWGLAADPAKQVREASYGLYFIGGLSIVVGMIAALFAVPELSRMGFGYVSALYGAAFLILGYFVSHRSAVALGVAVALVALDLVALFTTAASATSSPPIGGMIFRFLVMVFLIRGFGALRSLKSETA